MKTLTIGSLIAFALLLAIPFLPFVRSTPPNSPVIAVVSDFQKWSAATKEAEIVDYSLVFPQPRSSGQR